MKKYLEYKESEIEWMGLYPENWKIIRLRYLCEITTGDKDTVDKNDEGIYPFFVRSKDVKRINSYSYDGEAILTAGDGDICKIWHYINGKFDFHQRVYMLYNFNNITGKFLYYFLKENFIHEVLKLSAKSTVDSLRLPMFLDFPLCVPTLIEQTQIANYLDYKTGLIDAVIEKKELLIEKLKLQRQAIINEAVTKGLNPNAKMKDSGIEWLGEIPEHWEVCKMKYLVDLKSGDFIPASLIDSEGDYSVLGGNGLRGFTSKFNKEGDFVLIGRQGALCGNINYGKDKFWATEHAIVVNPISNIDTFYFGELLRAMNLNQYNQSAAQPGISVGKISNLRIPKIGLSEQEKISSFIKNKIELTINSVQLIETQTKKLKSYRQSIISEAVTGKIDVRDWVKP